MLCGASDVSGSVPGWPDGMLEHQMQRLQAMLSAVSECFKVVDRNYLLVDMNQAGLDLIEADSIDQVRGVSVLDLLLPEYQTAFKAGVQAALKGERVTQQFKIQGLKGSTRWMEQVSVALPPRFGESEPTEVAAFTRDITAFKETIARLEEQTQKAEAANRLKSEFLCNMGHEIRTPMNAIQGFADLLSQEDDSDARSDLVETIRRNADQLLNVVNDILDMSKIDAGQIELEMLPFDPVLLLGELISLLGSQAKQQGIDLRIDWKTAIPEQIVSDPTRLRQILLNLVGNALKFTREGSVTVEVECHPERQSIQFRIADTGIGMSTEQLDRITRFESFSQADSSSTRRFGGAGLGLRISNALATLLGSSIEIKSSLGQGSVFSFSIETGCLEGVPTYELSVLASASAG